MDVEEPEKKEKKVIEGNFQQEKHIDRKDLADFLTDLANELKESNELKIKTDEWELPFAVRDQVELEIDLDYDELEIEIEFDEDKSKKVSVE